MKCVISYTVPHIFFCLELLEQADNLVPNSHHWLSQCCYVWPSPSNFWHPFWLLSSAESAYNGHVSIRTGPWSNWKKITWSDKSRLVLDQVEGQCVCVICLGKRWQESAQWEEGRLMEAVSCSAGENLGSWHSCECYFGKYHLPKDCYRPWTPLHGSGLLSRIKDPTALHIDSE